NVGVTIDAATNRAALSIGLSSSPPNYHAFQFLDLSTHTFQAPIAVPTQSAEQFVMDPVHHLLFSASEDGYTTVVDYPTNKAYYRSIPSTGYPNYFDSSGVDCTTGI